jgi:hypothetical protein
LDAYGRTGLFLALERAALAARWLDPAVTARRAMACGA